MAGHSWSSTRAATQRQTPARRTPSKETPPAIPRMAITVKIASGNEPCPGGCSTSTQPTSAVARRPINNSAAVNAENTCGRTTRARGPLFVGTPCNAAASVHVDDKLPQLRKAMIAAMEVKSQHDADHHSAACEPVEPGWSQGCYLHHTQCAQRRWQRKHDQANAHYNCPHTRAAADAHRGKKPSPAADRAGTHRIQ